MDNCVCTNNRASGVPELLTACAFAIPEVLERAAWEGPAVASVTQGLTEEVN